MTHIEDDEEELEPAWPGFGAMFSGRAGRIAVGLLVAVAVGAFFTVREQQRYNSPANTQTVCIPVGDLVTPGTNLPAGGATAICVPGH